MRIPEARNLNPIAFLRRWSAFIDGWRSLVLGLGLAVLRVLTPFSLSGTTVAIRMKGSEDPVLCRPGTSDFHTLLQIWDDGEYRPARQFVVPPVRTVVDLGSNIGLSVRYFSELWPDAEILAVEPDPENAALARRNLARPIDAGRVVLENCFVGAEEGFAVPVRDPSAGHNETRMGPTGASPRPGRVPVKTMPRLLELLPDRPIDFLKCDIEGGERQLFEGGPGWIRRVKAFVVELHGMPPEWLADAVRRSGAEIETAEVRPVSGYDLTLVWARLTLP